MKTVNLTPYFEQIESLEFEIYISVISGYRIVLNALERHETVNQLIEAVRENPQAGQAVLDHLQEMLSSVGTPGHAFKYDGAIAAYLYVLSQTNVDLAAAAEQIAQMPSLFWAAKLAKQTLETDPTPRN